MGRKSEIRRMKRRKAKGMAIKDKKVEDVVGREDEAKAEEDDHTCTHSLSKCILFIVIVEGKLFTIKQSNRVTKQVHDCLVQNTFDKYKIFFSIVLIPICLILHKRPMLVVSSC